MSGIFPNAPDGGLPPNPASPNNPAAAYDPAFDPINTAALYYGNGCDVRLRPEVVNSIISNIAAVVDGGEVHYEAGRLTNLLLGVQYLIQRGLMSGALMIGGPNAYSTTLTPAATRYNDFMTLRMVPTIANAGAVSLNVNGLGNVPVLRNDGENLVDNDLRANIPVILVYYNGAFYVPYLVMSQVPKIITGAVDGWVRTDGNDTTGDGTENTPERAFRTINGAFTAMGARYSQSPRFVMNIRLGIPGTYAACELTTFGGEVNIIGDRANPNLYRIAGMAAGGYGHSVLISNTTCTLVGVTLLLDFPAPTIFWSLAVTANATVMMDEIRFLALTSNPQASFITVSGNAVMRSRNRVEFEGGGGSFSTIFWVQGAQFNGAGAGENGSMGFANMNAARSSVAVDYLGTCSFAGITPTISGCTGKQFEVTANSVLSTPWTLPGNIPGTQSSGGQYMGV